MNKLDDPREGEREGGRGEGEREGGNEEEKQGGRRRALSALAAAKSAPQWFTPAR